MHEFIRGAGSLPGLFFAQAERQGTRPFLWKRRKGAWASQSWREAAERVAAMAAGLRSFGFSAGERIALVSENRPEWILCDLAILAAGGVTVPAYVTNTPKDHRHILENSGATGVIVSTPALAERVLEEAAGLPRLRWIALMDVPEDSWGASRAGGRRLYRIEEIEAAGRGDAAAVPGWIAELRRSSPSSILHTSGSSGTPKGVVLSHGAILCNLEGAYLLLRDLNLGAEDLFLSFLPVSHAYERTAGQYFPIALGAQIYYAESAAQVPAALNEVRPTLMAAVPRLLEVIHQRMQSEVERSGSLQRRLFARTVALGRRDGEGGGGLSLAHRLESALLGRWVRNKVQSRFGGRLKAIISGGAPLSPEIGSFFAALGIRVLQGYGLTEAAPVVSCNPSRRPKHHTVGVPLPGVEVRVAPDGEIHVRGELVMDGYWEDPEGTRAVIRDGWLLTGDIGSLDEDGYLSIQERKKDIIKNSGGDMISPQRLEGALMLQPEIAQAAIFGHGRPHPVAVLYPEEDLLKTWSESRRLAPAAVLREPDFRQALSEAVTRANQSLSPPERVRRFLIADEPFSIENELLTPTLKFKRHRIRERYAEAIEQLYRGQG